MQSLTAFMRISSHELRRNGGRRYIRNFKYIRNGVQPNERLPQAATSQVGPAIWKVQKSAERFLASQAEQQLPKETTLVNKKPDTLGAFHVLTLTEKEAEAKHIPAPDITHQSFTMKNFLWTSLLLLSAAVAGMALATLSSEIAVLRKRIGALEKQQPEKPITHQPERAVLFTPMSLLLHEILSDTF